MSFSRYSIEKKQVSTDRGVTWQDVTPTETRLGNLVGIARTLIECEDMDCELEKTEYYLADSVLPSEICDRVIHEVPEGIVRNIMFTDGAFCCYTWYNVTPTNAYGEEYNIGHRNCIQELTTTYCPTWTYEGSDKGYFGVIGDSMYIGQCGISLQSCFTYDLVPWLEGKTTFRVLMKQHYVRAHCSDAWETDGEPEVYKIAERWKYVYNPTVGAHFKHQIATADSQGNLTWQDVQGANQVVYLNNDFDLDNWEYYPIGGFNVPQGVEIIDYVALDGIARMDVPSLLDKELTMKLYGNDVTPSGYFTQQGDYWGGRYSAYHIYNAEVIHTVVIGSASDTNVMSLTNEFQTCYFSDGSGFPTDEGQSDLQGICLKAIVSHSNKMYVLVPYRVRANYGQSDDYWNASEIGFIDKDGNKYPVEYIKLEGGELVKSANPFE